MKRKTILFAIMAILFTLVSCEVNKNLKRGDEYLALGEYYDAAAEYRKAYAKTPAKEKNQRGLIAQKMAYCYQKTNQAQKAVAAFANADRYKVITTAERLEYGRQLMKKADYKSAQTQFLLVLDSMPGSVMTKTLLESARTAAAQKAMGSHYTVKKMDIFNSRRAEYSPMFAGDNYDQLFFSSTRNEAQGTEISGITGTKPADIFVSTKDDKGKWGKPEPVEGGLNTEFDESICCFDPSGKEMYLTVCQTDPEYPRYARIMKSTRADASWGKPTEVAILTDTMTVLAHPAVSPDGQWLYFTSDMPGGHGGLDIWRIPISTTGLLGAVENLGSPINTEGDEEFPTFRPNGDFYFSSNGHPGLGGLDIFIAKVGKDGKYHLEHPGYPLNSQADDFGMTFDGQLNRGYFSSNRGDGRGWDHIYSFENPEIVQTVTGWVYEQDGYELQNAEVYIVGNDGTNKKISVKSDGSFTYAVEPGVSYLFLATCKGFLNHKEEVSVKASDKSEDTVLQFPLASISAPVLVDNVFYDFDKATLRPESSVALDKLVTMLTENPNITIELAAHCDYRGNDNYNKQLSQRRAESCVNYLIEHGIEKERLTPVGYGEEKPKTIRRKLTEKIPWLKENDVLTEEFILGQEKARQEVCNQLNRRTEFKVLRTTYGLFDKNGQLKEGVTLKKPSSVQNNNDDDDFEIEI